MGGVVAKEEWYKWAKQMNKQLRMNDNAAGTIAPPPVRCKMREHEWYQVVKIILLWYKWIRRLRKPFQIQRICMGCSTWKPMVIQIWLKRLCDFLSASRNGHIDSLAYSAYQITPSLSHPTPNLARITFSTQPLMPIHILENNNSSFHGRKSKPGITEMHLGFLPIMLIGCQLFTQSSWFKRILVVFLPNYVNQRDICSHLGHRA